MANTIIRLSGLFLIIGAALLGTAIIMTAFNPVVNQTLSPLVSLFLLISAIMLLLSLPAMYAKQAEEAGWLGITGHALLQTGILLLVVVASTPLLYTSLKLASGESLVVFLLGIALTMGLLLTGIATIRAGIFPRWTGILLLAATTGFFFVFFIAEFLPPQAGQAGSAFLGILLALALAWIGVSMWTGSSQPTWSPRI